MPPESQYSVPKTASLFASMITKRNAISEHHKLVSQVTPEVNDRPKVVEEWVDPKSEVVGELPGIGKYLVYYADSPKEQGGTIAVKPSEEKEIARIRERGKRGVRKRRKSTRAMSSPPPQSSGSAHSTSQVALRNLLEDPLSRAATKSRIDVSKLPFDPAPGGRHTGTFSAYNLHDADKNLRVVGAEESDSHPGKYYAILANRYNELVSDDPAWMYPRGGVGVHGRVSKHTLNFAATH